MKTKPWRGRCRNSLRSWTWLSGGRDCKRQCHHLIICFLIYDFKKSDQALLCDEQACPDCRGKPYSRYFEQFMKEWAIIWEVFIQAVVVGIQRKKYCIMHNFGADSSFWWKILMPWIYAWLPTDDKWIGINIFFCSLVMDETPFSVKTT